MGSFSNLYIIYRYVSHQLIGNSHIGIGVQHCRSLPRAEHACTI